MADPDYPIIGPAAKFLCLSYSTDLVFDMSVKMNRLVKSAWYQERWGRRVILQQDADAKGLFENTAGGSRISTSIGGTVTGRGGDYKIIDDPHNIKNVESQTMREAVVNDYDQVLKNRVTDPQSAAEIIVMQRTHEGDLSGHILANDADFVHLCLPAEFEPSRHCWTHVEGKPFWADPRTTPGELLWPERWDEQALAPFKKNPYTWCTPGESPVLMADLNLKPIAEIEVGDSVMGFTTGTEPSEQHQDAYSRRRLVHTKVLSISKSVRPVVKVTLDSGEIIR